MKKIYAFDFDGTLTTKDTLLEFIRFAKGNVGLAVGFLYYSPLIILMKLHLYPNWKVKQKIFAWFFKGMAIGDFERLCLVFSQQSRQLILPAGMEMIKKTLEEEDSTVVIISASIDNWVRPFFDGIGGNINILGTQIEVSNGRLTGRFISKNCYGQEKVRRLTALYPERENYELIAFGDSRGDRELLAYADKAFYKPFRNKKRNAGNRYEA
ncbi:haloacid dehalogenase-like hydrolase [Prevotella denticola]|uniref:HAD-IB family phosphatase n=1 Tax=Prevotella denticola TaxID=28129 RepID=UPI001BA8EE2D|nr:HAD-IB family phosphatase [Prevotella denticola]QUB92487.1 haloacid dehalogenase-like hydrolase [Prevotella denticola]